MLFLNMYDFLSSVNNKRRCFEELFVHTMKVNGVQKKLWTIFTFSVLTKKKKDLVLCFTEDIKFNRFG